jgi:hypothetical protein
LPSIVVSKIRGEAALWSLVGAKHLGSIMPWEWFVLCPEFASGCNTLKLLLN